ncbi:metal-sulfur cluster assembly factor [Paracerasibacillus soli]|uniref:Metal-sulfur cluster assembly factor n=1 Tax=Paracerasibacillus soli TaxID=480284 RepID=A0ABU5CNC9_9BACI|nr:metal-sulfur cluster assembly factor [Virgibacillus soli]MDY0407871.1 metal-sulfur cluster assembly factor [Virgibacillus soli]
MDEALKDNILGALENVIDPELGIDIINMGLVYNVALDDNGLCTVTMTLTTMGCPLAGHIEADVRRALSDIPEIKDIDVNIVWDPPWGKDKMTRYAKIALGIPINIANK